MFTFTKLPKGVKISPVPLRQLKIVQTIQKNLLIIFAILQFNKNTFRSTKGSLVLEYLFPYTVLLSSICYWGAWIVLVVSQVALNIGTMCHTLGHEFEPWWWQAL